MMTPENEGEQDSGTRLQALIARAGIASRRAAEGLITSGRVSVNGKIVNTLGARAMPDDIVAVDGKPIVAETLLHYIAMNKPPGFICAMADDYGRPLAASLLKPQIHERVYNVGRLDLDSCGLILFTNDGSFAAAVGHPSSGLEKEYEVETDSPLNQGFGPQFESGLAEGGETLRAKSVIVTGERTCVIRLIEGKNREIRRALELFRLKAVVLRRVAIGSVRLGDLVEGRWRNLTANEISALTAASTRAKKPGE